MTLVPGTLRERATRAESSESEAETTVVAMLKDITIEINYDLIIFVSKLEPELNIDYRLTILAKYIGEIIFGR